MPRPYTDRDVDQIKRMYRAGITTKRMSLELDRPIGSLLAKIHRLGIADRRRKATADIHFFVTTEERAKLAMRAMAEGKTLSGFMRAMVPAGAGVMCRPRPCLNIYIFNRYGRRP